MMREQARVGIVRQHARRVDVETSARTLLEGFSRQHRAWQATIHGIERGVPVTCVSSAAIKSVALEPERLMRRPGQHYAERSRNPSHRQREMPRPPTRG